MKAIDVAICDDQKSALDIIAASVKTMFQGRGVEARVDTFMTTEELQHALSRKKYDLLFLDIFFPGKKTDGISFFRSIDPDNRPELVFVSSDSNRVFETFDVRPFGFIRKDHFMKDLPGVVERFEKMKLAKEENSDVIHVRVSNGFLAINVNRFVYVECTKNVQTLVMEQGRTEKIRSRMSVLEEQLDRYGFIRIHKGYLVNPQFIKRIDPGSVTLTTGESLPIGRTKQNETAAKYMDYIHANGITIIG